jgi:hypothetical protein
MDRRKDHRGWQRLTHYKNLRRHRGHQMYAWSKNWHHRHMHSWSHSKHHRHN